MFETIFNFFKIVFMYLFIYLLESKFHILKTIHHPSTLNSKSRLVNPMDINVLTLH